MKKPPATLLESFDTPQTTPSPKYSGYLGLLDYQWRRGLGRHGTIWRSTEKHYADHLS
jgi:hypothetical protein